MGGDSTVGSSRGAFAGKCVDTVDEIPISEKDATHCAPPSFLEGRESRLARHGMPKPRSSGNYAALTRNSITTAAAAAAAV